MPNAVRRAHPDGIDVLIDLVDDSAGFATLASLVRPGGTAVTTRFAADEEGLLASGVTHVNFRLQERLSDGILERVADAVTQGRIVAPPIARISLEEVPAALDPALRRLASGKTVILL